MADADRERWDARWRERGEALAAPEPWLVGLDLPRAGRALDVAGGSGRHALYLAARGLDVTLCDVSPVALATGEAHARRAGLPLATRAVDLEQAPLPPGPWDLIVVFHYLQRELFSSFPAALAAGGMLVVCHPTRRNLERHAHPSARFLLEEGELQRLVVGLELRSAEEGWLESGRHEARVVGVKARQRA